MQSYQIILGLFVLLASACTTTIEPDIPVEPPRLVVNSVISPDSAAGARISKSKYVLDRAESFATVDNAQVALFEDGREVAQLSSAGTGWYTSTFHPKAGHQYLLQVMAEGFPTVEASSEIRPAVLIESLAVDSVQTPSGISCTNGDCETLYAKEYQIQLRFSDTKQQNDFYEIIGYGTVKDSFEVRDNFGNVVDYDVFLSRQRLYLTTNDPVLTSSDVGLGGEAFFGSSLLFTDELITDQAYIMIFRTDNFFFSDLQQIVVMLRTLSEDQYRYQRTRILQDFSEGDPFSEVVPAYTNVENGFGIFAGYSVDSVVVDID